MSREAEKEPALKEATLYDFVHHLESVPLEAQRAGVERLRHQDIAPSE